MKKIIIAAGLVASAWSSAQSYPPQAGTEGSTAIPKDSPLFQSWATGCSVVRGPQQINGNTANYATVGSPDNALGTPDGVNIVSLGDGGTATVTFARYITNGPGFDFAVFENGFISNFTGRAFLELGFVEVSSDGVHFFRFPSHNQYPPDFIQIAQGDPGGSGFATMDARYLNNFAGKYISGYGTPFDLSDLPDDPLLDKQRITHVKIIDVVGTNIDGYRTYDSYGNVAIDPFPTPFASSGFDLDAIGVINEGATLSANETAEKTIAFYPNPARDFVKFSIRQEAKVEIFDALGRLVKAGTTQDKAFPVSGLGKGIYQMKVQAEGRIQIHRLMVQ